MRHLILRLESPLMSFGGPTIDNYGVTREFPALSMLTGLFANALGWHRRERQAHQDLQDRIVFAAGLESASNRVERLQDVQNARLHQKDQAWTTRGQPQGRETSPSYNQVDAETPERGKYLLQRRYRDYLADMRVIVALRLKNANKSPDLEAVANALRTPARPLFIGRKSCLPSQPFVPSAPECWVEADTVLEALKNYPCANVGRHAQWPVSEDKGPEGARHIALCDERNWISGIHGGSRQIAEGWIDCRQEGGSA